MWRKKATSLSLILLIWLAVVSLLRFQWSFHWLSFCLGAFVGLAFFNFDHLLYLLWQVPEDPNRPRLIQALKTKKPALVLDLLSQTARTRQRLVAHSVVFQLALVVLAFFTLTSTSVLFGQGMVMGLLLYPLVIQAQSLLAGRTIKNWFWQVDFKLDRQQEGMYFLIMLIIFLLFSYLLI